MFGKKKKKKPTTRKPRANAGKKRASTQRTTSKKPAATSQAKKPATVKGNVKKPPEIKHNDDDERKPEKLIPININAPKQPTHSTPKANAKGGAVTTRRGRVTSITYHIKYD